jgi:hypothetical protein
MWTDCLLYFLFILLNRKGFIQVLGCIKTYFLFIASSFVWIHPIGHISNHYDLDHYYELHDADYPDLSSHQVTQERITFIRAPSNLHSTANKVNEQWHIVQDDLGRRHIGLVIEVVNSYNEIVLCVDALVSNSVFFQFPIQRAKTYLLDLSEEEENAVVLSKDLEHNLRVQGLFDLPDSLLVIKTFWIHIIQRRWKRAYKEKMRRLYLRGTLKSQRNFEICGKYGISTDNKNHYMLRGLLSGL